MASTPDDSIFAVGEDDGRCLLETSGDLLSPRKRSRQSMRSATPSSWASFRYGFGRLDLVAGDDEPHVGHLVCDRGSARTSRSSPFDSPDQPEEEERRPGGGAERATHGRLEDRMRDADDLLARHTERDELLDGAVAVDDDAIDRCEHPPPELDLRLRAPREDVVRREDDGTNPCARLEPAQVVARHAEPLDVEHVGRRARSISFCEPARVRPVLEALGDEAEPRAWTAAEQRRAVAEEHVVLAVALGRRQLGEEEVAAKEVDLVPRAASAPARLRSYGMV